MGIIDTHSHVTCAQLVDQIDSILEHMKENNIERVLIVCCRYEEALKAIEYANKYDCFDCAFGYHPENVDDYDDSGYVKLKEILQDPHMIALGEIGLDYYWVKDNAERQKKLFIDQIKIAQELDLPILIHMRDATLDTLNILKEYPCKGIMHCYSGSLETAKEVLKLGYYISFAGPLTFKNARNSVEVCEYVPIDRLFIETDAPYLTPHPFRGKQNEPSYVKYTFEKACEIKQIEAEVLMKQMWSNYTTLFKKAR